MGGKPTRDELRNRLDQIQRDAPEETSSELKKTLHELQVYQIELEMQNDELRRTQQSLEITRDRYTRLYDFAPMGYASLDSDGLIVDLNLTGAGILGFPREEIVGRPFAPLLTPGQSKAFFSHLYQVFGHTAPTPFTTELRIKGGDGGPRLLSLSSTTVEADRPPRCLTAFTDITEQRLAQDKLRQAASAFDSTLEAIVITDAELVITAINRAFCRITGYTEAEVAGLDLRSLDMIWPGTDEAPREDLWTTLQRHDQWRGEATFSRKNRELFPCWGTISAVTDSTGKPGSYVLVSSDITPVKQAQKRLAHLAHHDALTGLPNRLHFQANLTQSLAMAKRHARRVAMLYIDLDHFKNINDAMGHSCGDTLLSAMAQRLRRFVRSEDLVCRLGGDEFVVVFNDIEHSQDAAVLAEKLLGLLNRPIRLDGKEFVVGASVGISLYPDNAGNAEDLAKTADAALYRAKQEGRNTYTYYTEELTRQASHYLAIEQDIRDGLENQRFELFYQPQRSLAEGRITGLECLLRWRNPRNEVIPASHFVQIAEESGLIARLDEWALRAACAQFARWRDAGCAVPRLSINLSPRTLMKPNLAQLIKRVLDEFRVSPSCIELEVTESTLQTGLVAVSELNALKALGVMLAIDDFGTGYSCLASLKSLPIDRLKIDRSFVTDAPTDPSDAAIVRAIIAVGHSLGLKVVGEGVETEAQRLFLQNEACDECQGFLYQHPLPPANLWELLTAG